MFGLLALPLVAALSGCDDDPDESPAAVDAMATPDAASSPDADSADAYVITKNDKYVAPPVDAEIDAEVDAYVEPVPAIPDLLLLEEDLANDVWLDQKYFAPDDCAVVEGCIDNSGERLLLRFGVVTANVGGADLLMGRPEENLDLFEYSDCHEHWHFERYADYQLLDNEEVVSVGRKQAFCLMDSQQYLEEDPSVRQRARYNCSYQGISRGWQDTYHSRLDCQWIDVTDLMPGPYALAVQVNPDRILEELSYENNDATVDVIVPPYDIGGECPEGPNRDDFRRSCGWDMREVGRCERGDVVEIGCGGCGAFGGACEGDPMMKVCDGEMTQCLPSSSLVNRHGGCTEDNPCPHVEFACPESGVFTVWTASQIFGEPYVCDVAVRSGPPQLDRPCVNGGEGLERTCGWVHDEQVEGECLPGFTYEVGCNPECGEEGIGEACDGDPMLRVCPGDLPCLSPSSLDQNDDSCQNRCPIATFECPASGRFSVWHAAYRDGRGYACVPGVRRVR